MADYKKMYLILCRATADALDEMEGRAECDGAFRLLKEAMNRAEDVYIETADEREG